MNYNSSFFLCTFPVIFALYYFLTSKVSASVRTKTGNSLLLFVSYVVLACENVAATLWLAYVTGVTFCGAKYLARRRLPLFATLMLAVLPLLVFKYYGFACTVLSDIGLSCSSRSLVVPIGISFFTLQAIGYIIDVYRGKIAPESNLLDHSLFLAFFPQIVAGPISRYNMFMPQIKSARVFNAQQSTEGLRMINSRIAGMPNRYTRR